MPLSFMFPTTYVSDIYNMIYLLRYGTGSNAALWTAQPGQTRPQLRLNPFKYGKK